ncbi:DNA primase [Elusimicrobium minutum Pei191]|uniref:DNA primase n=1 Tax=Elusimicrobium minutum (strain Pei191) TaxID=445932 RepID=B2KBW9_ELUMP|nr:DNA primase [Elusimicrobium minutum]ACC97873.1 DNA primase [Elusimicrobium minutum Pei191]
MSDKIIEEIRDRVDIVELVREYVPSLKRAGKTYKGCCPFHNEKTPSFTVSQDRGLFYCFGCQTGGDVFAFLMKTENLSFSEAAKKLAERAGLEWKKEEVLTQEEKNRLEARKLLDFAKVFYNKTLLSSQGNEARGYLKKRSLTKETVEKFEIGFTPQGVDALSKAALANGYNANLLRSAGLAAQGQYGVRDYFRSRIMFPIINHRGETVGFGGRIFGEGEPKYLNSPETILFSKSRVLYGLNFAGPEIRKANYSILLEGYMDVIGVMQSGIGNCVAPLGTSFNEEHAKLLKRYSENAVILFDPDAAGIKASLRTALILIQQGLFVKVATLGEEGLDPDEFINKYGKEKFENILADAVDIIDFQADVLIKQHGGNLTPQNKTQIAAQLMEIVSVQPDPIVKSEWIKIVSEKLSVEEHLLTPKKTAVNTRRNTPPAPQVKKTNIPVEEEDLVAWLLKSPAHITQAQELDESKFTSRACYEIISTMDEILKQTPSTENIAPMLIKKLPQHENFILKISMAATPKDFNPARDIRDCAAKIERNYLSKKLAALKAEIKKMGVGSVPEALLRAQNELQKQIKNS